MVARPQFSRTIRLSELVIHCMPTSISHKISANQVRPFNITTVDDEIIHCWHVLPIGTYLRNEGAIINEESGFVEDIRKTQAFKILSMDPESRLVIYC